MTSVTSPKIAAAMAALSGEWQTSAEMGVSHHALKTLVARGLAECTNGGLREGYPQYGYRATAQLIAERAMEDMMLPSPAAPPPPPAASVEHKFSGTVQVRFGDAIVVMSVDDNNLLHVDGYVGSEESGNLEGKFVLAL